MKFQKRYLWLILCIIAALIMSWAATGHLYRTKLETQNPCAPVLMECREQVKVQVDELDRHHSQIIIAALIITAVGLVGYVRSYLKHKHK